MDRIESQTFTLTFGDRAENHRSMEIIGNEIEDGLSISDLKQAEKFFSKLGATCKLINLKNNVKGSVVESVYDSIDDAYILIIENGANYLLNPKTADDLYVEQHKLKKDTKAFMYGRVVNKKARHNLCFSDFSQKADYENKKGTVVNFDKVPLTKKLREIIPNIVKNDKVRNLQCEGNYYYDIRKTYIGFHGDTERKIVIAVRLGADFPLHYQWYHAGEKIGDVFTNVLKHGDMYFMSEKAVGQDWKKPSLYTLRHAAGNINLL